MLRRMPSFQGITDIVSRPSYLQNANYAILDYYGSVWNAFISFRIRPVRGFCGNGNGRSGSVKGVVFRDWLNSSLTL
jgi:hypothetical protein